ncbi:potassium channel subfamily K member 18 isoform X1 [Bombyx mori]|uniref:potassium channel subfamily K member 18 isoform X1 n=1 Tax=Bombyx mori TaxID=7091 RepID=UPI002ED3F531
MPRRKRRLASRIRAYIRGLLSFLFSNVGVIVLVVAYTIAGAFMFQAIEGESEMERMTHMALERNNTAENLWQNVTLALNLFNETAMKERITIELIHYQKKIVFAVRHGWDGGRSSRQWSFSSAFLYSLTVITTIGYGHLSPRTNWGKVVTILYTLLGMPLFLLYLTNLGELLARWFKCIYALVCHCRGCPGFTKRRAARFRQQLDISDAESIERPPHWKSGYLDSDCTPEYRIPPNARDFQRRPDYFRSASMPQPWERREALPAQPRGWSEPLAFRTDSEGTSEFSYVTFDAQTITVPISVCVCIMVGYIIFGSMLFGMWENWDQLDGAYFCFISLSSIGFGDLAPGERVYMPRIETLFIACSMYLMDFGLLRRDSIYTRVHQPSNTSRYSSIGFGDFVPGERVYTPRIETSFIACSMYLMLGMALVAMCFNLMQEQVIHYFAGLKRVLKRVSRCKR